MNRFLFLLVLLLPLGARAQTEPDGPLQWVRLPQYQLQYHVPADWTPVRQLTDTSLVVTYFNPDRTLRFTAGKVRNAAAHTTPAEALVQLARQYGIAANPPVKATYDGVQFLETTGTGRLDGQPQRYRALAAAHRGHLLLVYVTGAPEAFVAHQAEVRRILHSMTSYRGRVR
ncbi:hypothetical protein [Hymenobacter elongatus]|uniref:PsbP C-terminal domain-containing protein n=1 Tax=Hymenobacter elongatus TaxID=877208 RepID=A0A4Z0PKN9_9BACT|nr:hypothetical protein [Hymenobacter elongatus]TGE16557.1 hypothetical protein E5J99_09240 [Hymenobacter elongatus]